MGESSDTPLKLQFDRRVRLDFRGATITSDAGLLACRELDAALGLTETANDYIHESRTGRNVQHPLLPLLRQSVYSRLAGYEDTNDAERLAQDPAMRVIVGWQGTDKQAASTNAMSRFETEVLTLIHRRTACRRPAEETKGCASESGIMVLKQKTGPRKGAPDRCYHVTTPTASKSPSTTTAWWPMPG